MTSLTCAIVVEPNEIFRQGLVRIISQAGCPDCLGFQSSEQIEAVADPSWNKGLFLVNFGREGEDVARGVTFLKARRPESQIVVLSENYSHAQILGAIKAGASGYILSSMGSEAFVKSLELIALGQHVIPPQALELLVAGERVAADRILRVERQRSPAHSGLLSTREQEILTCIGRGMSNKLIAREWNISESTVKVHVKAILRKIRVKNRTEAALWAWDKNISGRVVPHSSEVAINTGKNGGALVY
jgi:two-component system, NarL family, nitrate/nitrite response regulator NarL